MINFSFNIHNPFSNRFEIIKCWNGSTPFPNKHWELQLDKTNEVIGIDIRLTTRTDHAGLWIGLSLLGYDILFNFYDSRHWDPIKNQWEVYED